MAQRIVDQTISIEDLEKEEKKQKASKKNVEQVESKDASVGADTTSTKSSKPSKQKKVRGQKYKNAKKNLDSDKEHSVKEAVTLIRKNAYADFKESIELHITLGTDPTNSDQRIRFTTILPHGTGKSITVLVVSDDNSGQKDNILYRDASVANDIVKGKISPQKDFDVVVAIPIVMKDLSKAARILGPKGMMPSPKTGTVTDDITKSIENLSKGQIEIKGQAGHAVLHQIVGNLDFKDEQLTENITFILDEIQKNNPGKTKKKFIQKAYICTSMGPSVRIAV